MNVKYSYVCTAYDKTFNVEKLIDLYTMMFNMYVRKTFAVIKTFSI